MDLTGNYTIYPGSPPGTGTFLNTPLFTNLLFTHVSTRSLYPGPPFNETKPPTWEILHVGNPGSNLYTVKLLGEENSVSILNDKSLVIYLVGLRQPANFSIEPAGNDLYRFHVPNSDSVWTVDDTGDDFLGGLVKLDKDTGLPSQRWTLNKIAQLD